MHSTFGSNKNRIPSLLGFTTVLFSLILAILVFTGAAMAAGITGPSKGPLAQATSAATTTAPAAVGTQEIPGAVETGGVPAPIQTGEAPDAQLTANAAIPNQANPGSNPAPGTGATDVNSSTSNSSSFPWLLALLVAVVVVLLIIAFVLMRTRRSTLATATTATTASTMPLPSSSTPVVTGTVPPTSTVVATPAPPATSTVASALVPPAVAAATAAATPPVARTLTCPNCSTVNEWGENFCHECGQDLRPLRASLIAAAAPPPEIVTDDMPYLETQDRVDEQLEYVLSRKVIVVGTAPGNDIVIDSAFKGYETVSPRHAELRRDGDGFTVVDLGSDNGTYVNDARTGENLLAEGDKLRFGSVRFVYRVP